MKDITTSRTTIGLVLQSHVRGKDDDYHNYCKFVIELLPSYSTSPSDVVLRFVITENFARAYELQNKTVVIHSQIMTS